MSKSMFCPVQYKPGFSRHANYDSNPYFSVRGYQSVGLGPMFAQPCSCHKVPGETSRRICLAQMKTNGSRHNTTTVSNAKTKETKSFRLTHWRNRIDRYHYRRLLDFRVGHTLSCWLSISIRVVNACKRVTLGRFTKGVCILRCKPILQHNRSSVMFNLCRNRFYLIVTSERGSIHGLILLL